METTLIVTSELVKEWKQNHLNEGHSLPSNETYYSFIKKYVGNQIEISQKSVNLFRDNNHSHVASSALKSLFNFLVEKKEYPDWILNIRFGKSKTIKKQPIGITTSEALQIINAMKRVTDRNLTILLFYLGLRLSEGLKLLWSDFNWDTWLKNKDDWGVVNLRHTKGDKWRKIPVPSEIMEKLYLDHLNNSPDKFSSTGIPIGDFVCDYNFNEYVNVDLLNSNGQIIKEDKKAKENRLREEKYRYLVHAESYYRDLLYKVSFETIGKKINPHRFRHAKAQDLMDKGLGLEYLKSFLGHSSLASTEIYAKASSELLMRELKKLDKK